MAFLFVLLLSAPRLPAKTTIHELVSRWNAIEKNLSQDDAGVIIASLDGFREEVQLFLSSGLYDLYRYTPFTGDDPPHRLFSHRGPQEFPEIRTLPEQILALRSALEQGDRNAAREYAAAINESLFRWLDLDRRAENYITQSYLRLFIVFAAFILLMVFAVRLLGGALYRSIRREQKTSNQSRLILEAQEAERSRIARELHDSVIGSLRHLSFLPYTKGAGREDIGAGCDALIRQVRDICRELSPPDFARLGLLSSVRNLCAAFRASSGIECRLAAPQNFKRAVLPTEDQFHCFRITQEALTNIEKHSKASEASVLIAEEDRTLVIMISDDGTGFAEKGDSGGTGLGISNMRERAEILGGSLTLITEPGSGVIVKLEVPFDVEESVWKKQLL